MINVGIINPGTMELDLREIEATPDTVKQLIGGDFQFIRLIGTLGMFCSLDQSTPDYNFDIQQVDGSLRQLRGTAIFTRFSNNQMLGISESDGEFIMRNLPTMDTDYMVLMIVNMMQEASNGETPTDYCNEDWEPYEDELLDYDIAKVKSLTGVAEVLPESFKVNGKVLYYLPPEENAVPMFIRELAVS